MIKAGNIGSWKEDSHALPLFELADRKTITKGCAKGEMKNPPFILGNQGISVFAQADGSYQLHSGERSWARLNWSGKREHGQVFSSLSFQEKEYPLVSWNSEKRQFGCGLAAWQFKWKELWIERSLCLPPSLHYGEELPFMLIGLRLRNSGRGALKLNWREGIRACYDFSMRHNIADWKERVTYPVSVQEKERWISASFNPQSRDSLVLREAEQEAWQECFPPKLHLALISEGGELSFSQKTDFAADLWANYDILIEGGEEKLLQIAVGYSRKSQNWLEIVNKQLPESRDFFRPLWKKALPPWQDDDDPQLCREMIWNAYILQAMANWNEKYQESYLPQGSVYEYGLGVSSLIRDHLQHALPLCYFAPELAAGVLRFTAKQSDSRGTIRPGNEGAGLHPLAVDQRSDLQLYALLLLAEYLRLQEDAEILSKEIILLDGKKVSLLECASFWLIFLRDMINTGKHGFIRLLGSDGNDDFYSSFKKLPYHQIFNQAESGSNTAMALVVLEKLTLTLENLAEEKVLAPRKKLLAEIVLAARDLRGELLNAVVRQLKKNKWLLRAFIDENIIGDEEIFLAPQNWLLSVKELETIHIQLWKQIKKRLWKDEPRGARQREKPGIRENGGIWYALNGLLVCGLLDCGKITEAEAVFEKITLRQHCLTYPERWIGCWSNGDSYNSHNVTNPDKAGRVDSFLHPMPVFCAHAHAWPLYSWLRIRQKKRI